MGVRGGREGGEEYECRGKGGRERRGKEARGMGGKERKKVGGGK